MATADILVVEDDPDLRHLVEVLLRKRGFDVRACDNGEDGLHAARTSPPDLIILDVAMPRRTGWSVLDELRRDPAFVAVPVLLMTAFNDPDARAQGLKLGADDFIPKPFRLEELEMRVTRALRNRAQTIYFARGLARATEESRSTVLSGSLAQFTPLTMLSLLHLERKSGELVLTSSANWREARVFLRDGFIVCTDIDRHELPADEVLATVAEWTDGEFTFVSDGVELADPVLPQTPDLIAAAHHRLVARRAN